MNQNKIIIDTSLMDLTFYKRERFNRTHAWVDILINANKEDAMDFNNGDEILIKKGELLTSIKSLSEKWKWNYQTVSKFLSLLKKQNLIDYKSDNKKTILTINNYNQYLGE
jgi:hypothetical protein